MLKPLPRSVWSALRPFLMSLVVPLTPTRKHTRLAPLREGVQHFLLAEEVR